MYLAQSSFDPQLIKEDILQFCKNLIKVIENDRTLAGLSFLSALPEGHSSTEILSGGKRISRKTLNPFEKALIRYC